MNTQDRIAIISKLVSDHKAVSEYFDMLRHIAGVSCESKLFDAVFKGFDSYIKAVSTLVGDDFGFISWFIHENDYGGKKLSAKSPRKKPKQIKTVEDLVNVIEGFHG